MGAFSNAGIGRGVLDWNANQNKRRGELSTLFETFKKNNPDATAEDYNQYIESILGPSEFYLRGNLPGKQMLERMEGDNTRLRKRRENDENIATSTAELQFSTALQRQAQGMMMSHTDEEIVASLAGDEKDEGYAERYQRVQKLIGNLDPARKSMMSKLYSEKVTEILALIKDSDGEVNIDQMVKNIMDQFGGKNLPGLEEFAKKLKAKAKFEVEKKEKARDTLVKNRKYKFFQELGQNGLWAEQMASGTKSRAEVEKLVKGLAEFNDIDVVKNPELLEEAMLVLSNTRDERVAEKTKLLTTKTNASEIARLEQRHKTQITGLASATGMFDEGQKGIIGRLSTRYWMPQAVIQKLFQFVGDKKYENPWEAHELFLESIGGAEAAGMVENSNIAAIAAETTGKIVPKQQTAQGVIDEVTRDVESYRLKGVAKVNQLTDAYDRAKDSGITQEFQMLLSDINNLKAALGAASGELSKSTQYLLSNISEWIKGNQQFVQSDVDAMSSNLDKVNANLGQSIRVIEEMVIAQIKEMEGSADAQQALIERNRALAQQKIDDKVPLEVVNPLPLEGSS